MNKTTWSHFDRKHNPEYKVWVDFIKSQGYTPITDTEKTYAVKMEDYQAERLKIKIRVERQKKCFDIINKNYIVNGKSLTWFDTLTDSQKVVASQWVEDWRNATETGIIPETPSFVEW